MEDSVVTTDHYANIINLDKARTELELTEVKRLQVERNNNGKDKMAHVLILQNIESRGGS